MKKTNSKYAAYRAAGPYFNLIRAALGDLVDGAHFFEIVSDHIVYEVLYDFPGWPRVIEGRSELMAEFRGYGDAIHLHDADNLIVHKADEGSVIVAEYQIHGTILATGAAYRQSLLLSDHNRRKEDRALEALHGLARGLEGPV